MHDTGQPHRSPELLDPSQPLTEEVAEAYLASAAFHPGVPRFLGVEVESLVRHATGTRRVPAARLETAVAAAQDGVRHGRLTMEAGGAVEISSPPSPGIDECVRRTGEDLRAVREVLHAAGLVPVDSALDPLRPPRRVVRTPRYAAMERYLDRDGPDGRWMMCSTASVQVCLDAGHDQDGPLGFRHRWTLAHAVGPVLVAAFANSPLRMGRPTGWRSTRQALWYGLDPGRTTPPAGGDPREAWARYALDAGVMCVRDAGQRWMVPEGLTFRRWIQSRLPRPPALDDLDYHVTTLFPPVRPRGYLELRMIDGQSADAWPVPLAVASALFDDPRAADEALAATERLHSDGTPFPGGPWERAARSGLRDSALASAALVCFTAAYEALGRQNASRGVRDTVATFIERYVSRGRTPADDVLDAVDRSG